MVEPAAKSFLPDRRDMLRCVAATDTVDVLIIGAGINGAATFRDLSRQGRHSILLIDREDFGAGASMASSRMAHGGLRYLENGEFRLTREAVQERNMLLRHAPMVVSAQQMVIPLRSITAGLGMALRRIVGLGGKYTERGALLTEIGLRFYDWYARKNTATPRHRTYWGAAARRRFPGLGTGICAVATYYDGLILSPERIALSLVTDGVNANPKSHALNHCSLVRRKGAQVVLKDELGSAEFTVRARIVINAGGAWIDRINAALGESTQMVSGAKGSHLVIDHSRLHGLFEGQGFVFEDGMGRVCIAYPFEDKVIVGSTDIPIDDPDSARCSEDETRYLLNVLQVLFPDIALDVRHVIHTYCGVRPLVTSNAATPGQASRDHKLDKLPPRSDRPFPIIALSGGKWTTFRAFAEEATNAVLALDGKVRKFQTNTSPAGATFTDLEVRQADRLEREYGHQAPQVRAVMAEPGNDETLPGSDLTIGEIRYMIRHEMAVTVDDIVRRRTRLALGGRASPDVIARLVQLLSEETGHTPVVCEHHPDTMADCTGLS